MSQSNDHMHMYHMYDQTGDRDAKIKSKQTLQVMIENNLAGEKL